MFTQIDIERAKNQMSIKDLAKTAGINYYTLCAKLNGHSEFTRAEMLQIQAAFPQHVSLDVLFESSNKSA